MAQQALSVAITGAAGNIAYSLLFRIASGEVFGPDTAIDLRMLEIEPALPALDGVHMELDDCAYPLLRSVTKTSDPKVAFKDVDWALLVGAAPRKQGMERADLLKVNGGIFVAQGQALNEVAKSTTKVFVVGNPCNTNAFIAKETAKNLDPKNFFAMTMLDQNRAKAQLAQRSNVNVDNIKKLAVWGNHSTTMYPDFYNATIQGKPVVDVINDEAWLKGEFLETIQKRGAAIIKARGASSAASAANAAIDTVKNLMTPTPEGDFFSVAVASDGSYGVPEGLMFSFPIRSDGKSWQLVQNIELTGFSKEKIAATQDELLKEKEAVASLL